jgi:hypothetical protein
MVTYQSSSKTNKRTKVNFHNKGKLFVILFASLSAHYQDQYLIWHHDDLTAAFH